MNSPECDTFSSSTDKVVFFLQVQREFIETDDALHHGYLNRFKSGGVVVGELLEDMSGSETEGAQAVQDGSLEA